MLPRSIRKKDQISIEDLFERPKAREPSRILFAYIIASSQPTFQMFYIAPWILPCLLSLGSCVMQKIDCDSGGVCDLEEVVDTKKIHCKKYEFDNQNFIFKLNTMYTTRARQTPGNVIHWWSLLFLMRAWIWCLRRRGRRFTFFACNPHACLRHPNQIPLAEGVFSMNLTAYQERLVTAYS